MFEDEVYKLLQAGIATDLLVGKGEADTYHVGIRLRTFGKDVPKNLMIMAEGEDFAAAMEFCLEKANAGRWEHLVWAARPWPLVTRLAGSSAYGLDDFV